MQNSGGQTVFAFEDGFEIAIEVVSYVADLLEDAVAVVAVILVLEMQRVQTFDVWVDSLPLGEDLRADWVRSLRDADLRKKCHWPTLEFEGSRRALENLGY